MAEIEAGVLREFFENEWGHLEPLLQNRLMSEIRFLTFAKDRGFKVNGVVSGDPGEFLERGWLVADGCDFADKPQFHPFRILPVHQIEPLYRMPISFGIDCGSEAAAKHVQEILALRPENLEDQIAAKATYWGAVADLAVLLEPIYWPAITGHVTRSGFMTQDEFDELRHVHRGRVLELVASLDEPLWRETHESVRLAAAAMDDNSSLYLLMRYATWTRRERLEGRLGGALWLRHIGEVLRRAFEEIHGVQWLEEDVAFGTWRPGGRKLALGAERPVDDVLESRRYLARKFGLHTASHVRWYVEGQTEYWAIALLLSDPSALGVELQNLNGGLETNENNAAMRFGTMLEEDLRQKRFSFVTFDTDEENAVRAIRRKVADDRVVGSILANGPDFEFANFTVDELVNVLLDLDKAAGLEVEAVVGADFSDAGGCTDLIARYTEVMGRPPAGHKGKEWGEKLADVAEETPVLPDGRVRPFVDQVQSALRSRRVDYDYQHEHFMFDPDSFASIERPAPDAET